MISVANEYHNHFLLVTWNFATAFQNWNKLFSIFFLLLFCTNEIKVKYTKSFLHNFTSARHPTYSIIIKTLSEILQTQKEHQKFSHCKDNIPDHQTCHECLFVCVQFFNKALNAKIFFGIMWNQKNKTLIVFVGEKNKGCLFIMCFV